MSAHKPQLIHESLDGLPRTARFLFNGLLTQVLFMTGYNLSVAAFEPRGFEPATIYAVFYLGYIPVGHFLGCCFVFGWPADYLTNLAANAPIGLTAMALGTALTGLLSKVEFNASAVEWIAAATGREPPTPEEEEGEFYSSLVVLAATSLWSFLLAVYVNSAPADGKKSPVEKDPAKEL